MKDVWHEDMFATDPRDLPLDYKSNAQPTALLGWFVPWILKTKAAQDSILKHAYVCVVPDTAHMLLLFMTLINMILAEFLEHAYRKT